MTVTRQIAATAMLAGLAVGTASPALAAPTMNGHYIRSEFPSWGQPLDADWYFTPCGDGCTEIKDEPDFSQARLVNGQWTMDEWHGTVVCQFGGEVPDATSTHYSWDANTLAGTSLVTWTKAACGRWWPGLPSTFPIQLRLAP